MTQTIFIRPKLFSNKKLIPSLLRINERFSTDTETKKLGLFERRI
jgi:hypothetical protein